MKDQDLRYKRPGAANDSTSQEDKRDHEYSSSAETTLQLSAVSVKIL